MGVAFQYNHSHRKNLIKINDLGGVSQLKVVLLFVLILGYFLFFLLFLGELLGKKNRTAIFSHQISPSLDGITIDFGINDFQ